MQQSNITRILKKTINLFLRKAQLKKIELILINIYLCAREVRFFL
jgi:hypothetical protein